MSRRSKASSSVSVPTDGVRVLVEVLNGETITVSDLAKATTLTRGTMRSALERLRESGLIEDTSVKELACAVEVLADADDENLLLASMAEATVEELIAKDPHGMWSASARQDARERHERLVDFFMPDTVDQPAEVWHAKREAEMRQDLLTQYGFYGVEDLADLHGSRARNRHQLGSRWQRDGLIFGVPLGGRTVFPAFQIDATEGRPRKIVAEVLAAMPRDEMSPWSVALWWNAPNPTLAAHARPIELLGTAGERKLVAAARALSEPEPL